MAVHLLFINANDLHSRLSEVAWDQLSGQAWLGGAKVCTLIYSVRTANPNTLRSNSLMHSATSSGSFKFK